MLRGSLFGITIGKGALVFAAAGNTGEDVDHEDCFGFCWESDVHFPCELDDVVCIGGTEWGYSGVRDPSSSWGKQHRVDYRGFAITGRQDNSVDFYAPVEVWSGPQPDGAGNIVVGGNARRVGGTSESSPFAAGIAALVLAPDPTLSADEVFAILLDTANSDVDKL